MIEKRYMSIISEKDFIIFLKKISKSSNTKEIKAIISELYEQDEILSDIDTDNINTDENSEGGYDFYDEEYAIENIDIKIKEIIEDEMANEEISQANLSSPTREFMKKYGIYDKWGLIMSFNKILINTDATSFITTELSDLRDLILSEYKSRVIKLYKKQQSEEL